MKFRDIIPEVPSHGEYCLVAISGDCSQGAMSDKSDYIPVGPGHWELTKMYLRNQLELSFASAENSHLTLERLVREHHDIGNALIALGVFHHKWHKRTEWVLSETDEFGAPVNCDGKLNRCDNKDGGEGDE